jgi:putative DNA primase/helicase
MSTKAADIAAQVAARAAGLMPEEEKKPLDDIFVNSCLSANERGDGVMYASLHQGDYLFNTTRKDGKWYVWAGHVWEEDDFRRSFAAVEDCAVEYERLLKQVKQDIIDEDIDKKHIDAWKLKHRDKLQSRVDRLRGEAGVNKTLTWAPVVDLAMACREDDFNKRPMLLPCPNGVINLTTGELETGRPADRMSMAIDVPYDKHADYELWHTTLCEVCGSEEVANFLKRSFGYAITGHAFEQYIWVFLGSGRNGKGIIFNLIGEILGPFYHEISKAMILEQRNPPTANAASEHLYSLLGKRIIVGAETNKGQKIDAAAVKELTGEDRVKCRPNFSSELNFLPSHTLFLHTNHPPVGLTSDFAMVQRLLLIDFPYRYVDDVEGEKKKYPRHADTFKKKNKHLKKELMANKAGILRWLVEGCLEWQKIGLAPPQSILSAVNKLARDEDYVGQFVADCLAEIPEGITAERRIPCTTMYTAFEWWWNMNQDQQERRIPAMKTINKELRERGFTVEKAGGKTWVYDYQISYDVALDIDKWVAGGRKS